MIALPVRLRIEERRDLMRRLAERLGTRTAGGLALLADEAPGLGPGVHRFAIEGTAGEIKVRGVQEIGPAAVATVSGGGAAGGAAAAPRVYQRDKVGIGGLPDKLGVLLEVDEFSASESAPARVRIAFKDGTEAGRAAAAEEAFRFAGERFAASLLKGGAEARELALGPLSGAAIRKWLRGRWRPPGGGLIPEPAPPHLAALAMVEGPKRTGDHLLVREIGSAPRAAAVVALLKPDNVPAGFEVARGFDRRILDKALAALAWEAVKETATDPRPAPVPYSEEAPADFQTPGFVLGAPARAAGTVRETSHGHGPRLAALDLALSSPEGKPIGSLVERHLYGLPGDGFAIVASSSQEGRTAVLCGGPAKLLPKWLERLAKALA